jgi:PAS domain S-box-containing protein
MTALSAERCVVLVGTGEDERVWAFRRDAAGDVAAELLGGAALGSLALARVGGQEPAGFVVSRFVTRDNVGGLLAVELPSAAGDAQALVDAAAVHVGVAVGASSLLEAVTSAKQVWEGTFDAMTEGVVMHDAEFRIVRANRAFARLVRTKPAKLVGGDLLELFSDENRTALAAARDRVAATRRPYEFEIEETAFGRLLSFSVSRLQTAAGARFIHTVRDVTDGRQMHERLAQSAKMASIGNLAAGVAHEINTPLATIAGSAQSLERQLAVIPELREHPRWEAVAARLEAIVEQSFRCKRITHDLLHYAAPTRPDVVSTDLARVAREALETLERQRDVRAVEVREAGAAALVATDPGLVRQVLINLVSNALDAVDGSERGAVTVEVRHLARGPRVAVRDTGPGIAPEDLERVFDPFFTTKPPGKGTGLGLSISQSIVASLGGRLEARSRPGRGATFTLHLPRTARQAEG